MKQKIGFRIRRKKKKFFVCQKLMQKTPSRIKTIQQKRKNKRFSSY